MPRPTKRVECDGAERARLSEMSRSRRGQAGLALRARMVLRCVEGLTLRAVAAECGVTVGTVLRWRDRFVEGGPGALGDRPKTGRPATHGKEFATAALARLAQPPPEGFGQWDGALLAKELGCSKHAVWRLLRGQRISLARKRSWCVSTDPEFAAKAADVVGLYLSRDERALVVCVDEKPNIQALSRRTGYAVTSDGKLWPGGWRARTGGTAP
jgi:transposase